MYVITNMYMSRNCNDSGCVGICIGLYTCTRRSICVCTTVEPVEHEYEHVEAYVCICLRLCTGVTKHMIATSHISSYICMYVCMYVYIYIYSPGPSPSPPSPPAPSPPPPAPAPAPAPVYVYIITYICVPMCFCVYVSMYSCMHSNYLQYVHVHACVFVRVSVHVSM